MKTTLDETTKILIGLQRGLGQKLSKYIEARVASDLVARVVKRVQNYGIDANGKPFSPYSTKPTFLVLNDYALNKKAFPVLVARHKKTVAKAKKSLSKESFEGIRSKGYTAKSVQVPGGYAEIRRAAGYETDHKDFTVTKQMWRSVKVKSVTLSGSKIFITYGATDPESEKKLSGNSKREGINIITPSKKELNEASELVVKWLGDYLQKMFD